MVTYSSRLTIDSVPPTILVKLPCLPHMQLWVVIAGVVVVVETALVVVVVVVVIVLVVMVVVVVVVEVVIVLVVMVVVVVVVVVVIVEGVEPGQQGLVAKISKKIPCRTFIRSMFVCFHLTS